MPLQPPEHLLKMGSSGKEAQYVFGALGSWKSSIWASYANAYRETGTPGTFRVISTEPERAYVANEAYPDWYENVSIIEVGNWDTFIAACEVVSIDHTADDWIIIDSIGYIHDWTRDEWFIQNWDMSWMDVRAKGNIQKTMQEVGQHNWTRINTVYMKTMRDFLYSFKGHRFAVAQSKDFTDWDKPDGFMRRTFGHVGEKPGAHKDDWYLFHTFFHAGVDRHENIGKLTTIKDRGKRLYLDKYGLPNLDLGGAALGYLRAVADWQDI